MESSNFEQDKERLRAELEESLYVRCEAVLAKLVGEIMSDPHTVTASILGIDVQEIIKRVISEKLDAYTKEE